jgi:hypothetical protein
MMTLALPGPTGSLTKNDEAQGRLNGTCARVRARDVAVSDEVDVSM